MYMLTSLCFNYDGAPMSELAKNASYVPASKYKKRVQKLNTTEL